MTRRELVNQIRKKKSFLCVGLDTDLNRLPKHLLGLDDPVFEFNKRIIDATKEFCVAYKPNIAFYEKMGPKGWVSLQKTIDYIPKTHFTIADAKRGDIGNTSKMYASTFFETYNFDSITVAPYMGEDSVKPFLEYEGKWVISLALTSNKGSYDFQYFKNKAGKFLYEEVLEKTSKWGSEKDLMFVVGATHPKDFVNIRKIIPQHFLLVPGVGAQGGDLDAICNYAMNEDVGLLVNSSRGIIYAGDGLDFAEKAKKEALKIQLEMSNFL